MCKGSVTLKLIKQKTLVTVFRSHNLKFILYEVFLQWFWFGLNLFYKFDNWDNWKITCSQKKWLNKQLKAIPNWISFEFQIDGHGWLFFFDKRLTQDIFILTSLFSHSLNYGHSRTKHPILISLSLYIYTHIYYYY